MYDNTNIEDVFIFNGNIIYNYKDSVFYKNIRELELFYNIRYLIKSIVSLQMNTVQTYNIKIKKWINWTIIFKRTIHKLL